VGLWARIKVDATAYSSLANVCLVVVAVVALIVSVVQLEEAKLALQNGLVYTMQKDARDIAADYAAGKNKDGRATSLDEVFASMQSIFLQRQLGSVPDRIWTILDSDMRNFFARSDICTAWKREDRTFLSPDFKAYVARLTPDACK
jgi:hypothetical protein